MRICGLASFEFSATKAPRRLGVFTHRAFGTRPDCRKQLCVFSLSNEAQSCRHGFTSSRETHGAAAPLLARGPHPSEKSRHSSASSGLKSDGLPDAEIVRVRTSPEGISKVSVTVNQGSSGGRAQPASRRAMANSLIAKGPGVTGSGSVPAGRSPASQR